MRLGLGLGLGSGQVVSGGGGSVTYSDEATAYFTVLDAIAPISTTRKDAINKFVIAIKDAGIWTIADKIGILANHTIEHAAVNLKYPTKTTDADGLGTLNYINGNPSMGITNGQNSGLVKDVTANIAISTRYQPNGTHNYKTAEATIAMWIMELEDNNDYACSDPGAITYIRPKTSNTTLVMKINNKAGTLIRTPAAGFHLAVTTAGAAKTTFNINGTEGVLNVDTGDTLPSGEIFLGASAIATYPLLKPLAFYFIGGALTTGAGGQATALYNAVRQYLLDVAVI